MVNQVNQNKNAEEHSPDAPFTGRFTFKVDGMVIGRFMDVSGLSAEIEIKEVTEGGQNQFEHKLPGRMKWPNLVLKRGITRTDLLWDWFNKCSGDGFAGEDDRITRATGAVTLLNSNGTPRRTWSFEGAFPIKWTGPDLSASSSEIATEELEIAHHGIKAQNTTLPF